MVMLPFFFAGVEFAVEAFFLFREDLPVTKRFENKRLYILKALQKKEKQDSLAVVCAKICSAVRVLPIFAESELNSLKQK